MAATQFTYNGISFDYILTKSCSWTPQFTDDGVDYLYDEVHIKIQAVLNLSLSPAEGNGSIPDALNKIKGCLSSARGNLRFTDGQGTLVQTEGVDAKYGPIPGSLDIFQISNSTTYLITYDITTWQYKCCNEEGFGTDTPIYLAHRWTESVSLDEEFYSTVTRTGKMWFPGDKAFDGTYADGLRGLVVPSMKDGFHRTKQEYKVDSDNLILNYTIVDKEVYKCAPPPAARFEGKYSITTTNGVTAHEECHAKVWGFKDSSKGDLYSLAIQMCLQRIGIPPTGGIGHSGQVQLVGGYLSDDLHQNCVEARFRIRITRQNKSVTDAGIQKPLRWDNVDTLANETSKSPDHGYRGTALVKLVTAAFADPCGTPGMQPADDVEDDEEDDEDDGEFTPPEIIEEDLSDDDDTDLVEEELEDGMYTNFWQDISYSRNEHLLHFPVVGTYVTQFARVAMPTITKTVSWFLERWGEDQAKLPDWTPTDNEVLLDKTIMPTTTEIAPDGTSNIYRTSGVYTYGIIDASEVDKYYVGRMPWVVDASYDDYITEGTDPDDDFRLDVCNPTD